MPTRVREAFAKINLYLKIVNRRSDGYHNIASIMQQIDLSDTVTVTTRKDTGAIRVTCTNPEVPCDDSNIAWRCARVFLDILGKDDISVQIDIVKRIPMAGGLAGGSSDGAAVLLALNDIMEHPFSDEELRRIGAGIGADIPFCLVGGTCECYGIGNSISRIDTYATPSYTILLVSPGGRVSTPEAYEKIDEYIRSRPKYDGSIPDILDDFFDGKIPVQHLQNDFENVIIPERPDIAELKQRLISFGASAALMSGSGPSLFGIFTKHKDAIAAYRVLEDEGIKSFVCRPLLKF